MEETWKPVTGFEKFYEISNKGRIKSLRRKVNIWNGQRTLEERIVRELQLLSGGSKAQTEGNANAQQKNDDLPF